MIQIFVALDKWSNYCVEVGLNGICEKKTIPSVCLCMRIRSKCWLVVANVDVSVYQIHLNVQNSPLPPLQELIFCLYYTEQIATQNLNFWMSLRWDRERDRDVIWILCRINSMQGAFGIAE